MAATLLTLAIALALFVWTFFPLFREPEEIQQGRSPSDLDEAVSRSLRELETDLKLDKITREDLEDIQGHLANESST